MIVSRRNYISYKVLNFIVVPFVEGLEVIHGLSLSGRLEMILSGPSYLFLCDYLLRLFSIVLILKKILNEALSRRKLLQVNILEKLDH